jgi:multimeric flavodoxin WrbA
MPFRILAIHCSGRKTGYTASVMSQAVEGAKEVKGAEIDIVHIHDYTIRPCISCFECIRNPGSGCILDDDMGKDGELWKKTKKANGLLIADPVHMWSSSVGCHAFIERLYPYLWTGEINGLPFVYIACSSNQGFHRFSAKEICRRVIPYGFRTIATLPVHTVYLKESFKKARELGKELALAAKKDAEEGRQPFKNEREKFRYYQSKISPAFDIYLENLTDGKNTYEDSVFPQAIKTFKNEEARKMIVKAAEEFKKCLKFYQQGDVEKAIDSIVTTGDYWTNATWKEYLEENVVGSKKPKAYRPLPEE